MSPTNKLRRSRNSSSSPNINELKIRYAYKSFALLPKQLPAITSCRCSFKWKRYKLRFLLVSHRAEKSREQKIKYLSGRAHSYSRRFRLKAQDGCRRYSVVVDFSAMSQENKNRSIERRWSNHLRPRLDFRRSLVSGLRPSRVPSGEERGLLSRTAAGDRAYLRPCWSSILSI